MFLDICRFTNIQQTNRLYDFENGRENELNNL